MKELEKLYNRIIQLVFNSAAASEQKLLLIKGLSQYLMLANI